MGARPGIVIAVFASVLAAVALPTSPARAQNEDLQRLESRIASVEKTMAAPPQRRALEPLEMQLLICVLGLLGLVWLFRSILENDANERVQTLKAKEEGAAALLKALAQNPASVNELSENVARVAVQAAQLSLELRNSITQVRNGLDAILKRLELMNRSGSPP